MLVLRVVGLKVFRMANSNKGRTSVATSRELYMKTGLSNVEDRVDRQDDTRVPAAGSWLEHEDQYDKHAIANPLRPKSEVTEVKYDFLGRKDRASVLSSAGASPQFGASLPFNGK